MPCKFAVCSNLFTHGNLWVLKNSLKCVRGFQIELEFRGAGFLRRGRNRSTRRNTSQAKDWTSNNPNQHMASTPGFEPRATLVRGSNAPPLLPQRASRTQRAFEQIQKNAKYSPRRKRKDSKGRSMNFDWINVVFAFVALNVTVPTFLKRLLMLDKQDLRTRVGERIFKT